MTRAPASTTNSMLAQTVRQLRPGRLLAWFMLGVLVIQTIRVDPSRDFSSEITRMEPTGEANEYSWLSHDVPIPKADPSNAESNGWFEPGFRIHAHSTVELHHVDPSDTTTLFQPSLLPPVPVAGKPDNPPLACTPQAYANATRSDYAAGAVVPLRRFVLLDKAKVVVPVHKTSETVFATCRFQDYRYSDHFAHFAQQFFRCWSFWSAYPEMQPVFLTTTGKQWSSVLTEEFNRGILDILPQLGVTVISPSNQTILELEATKTQSVSAHSLGPILHPSADHFQSSSVQEMNALRDQVGSVLNLTASSETACQRREPRIVIINRRENRQIRNVAEIAQGLQQHLNLTYDIPEVFFEDATFQEQVDTFLTMDILITPHGAQETGIAFMPNCAGVVELMPQDYYYPKFFGTLAATAGLEHVVLHQTTNATTQEWIISQRDVSFCPPPSSVKGAVDLILQRMQRCCASE